MVEDSLNDGTVAFGRDSLVTGAVVVVVVVKTQRKAFEDRGRKFARFAAPMFFGISVEEGFVEFAPDEFERLLLEIRWRFDGLIGAFGDEGAGLCGGKGGSEELIDRVEIDRE